MTPRRSPEDHAPGPITAMVALILVIVAGAFVLTIVLGLFPTHDPAVPKVPATSTTFAPPCATPPSTSAPGLCIRADGHSELVDQGGHVYKTFP